MRVYKGIDALPVERESVVTVGSFDGVHRGHRVLLGRVVELARQRGLCPTVVTFAVHPRNCMGAEGVGELSVESEKIMLLERAGIEAVVILPFDAVCGMDAEEWAREVLGRGLRAKGVVVGYDHRFGRGRVGDVALLREVGEECGFDVALVDEQFADGAHVSSTVVRRAIIEGDMDEACRLLGYPYMVAGECSEGCVRVVSDSKLLPAEGEYPVTIELDGEKQCAIATIGESGLYIKAPECVPLSGSVIVYFDARKMA